MNSSSLSNYEELKSRFQKYFEIVDKLGNFYFVNKKSTNVYLTIDSEDLNRLFDGLNDDINSYKPRFKEKFGEKYLRDVCMDLLATIDEKNIFEQLIRIVKSWEEADCNEFPPQLPFIAMFVVAAEKMGEDSEFIDWRNYYTQLHKYMSPSVSKGSLEGNFRDTFGNQTTATSREELFMKLSTWIENNSNYGKNTFYTNSDDDHRGWILNQCLINTKDKNILPEFFRDQNFEHGNPYYSEKQIYKAFKRYLSNDLKAKSFSKSLRNNVLDESLDETFRKRISETLKDRFTNWDGEILTREGYKSLEILYVIEKNGFDNEKLEIKLFLDDSSKNLFDSLDSDSIIAYDNDDKDKNQLILEEDLFIKSKYFSKELESMGFEEKIWKLVNQDINARIVSYEKQIRLFKFEEFQLQEFVEVSKNESIAFKTPYIAVFKKEFKEEINKWLVENPNYDYKIENLKDFGDICIIEDLKLIDSQNFKITSSLLEVFLPTEAKSEKIELIGGLKLGSKTYLSRELPDIFIPESLREDINLEIKINDLKFSNEKEVIKKSEYVVDEFQKDYVITVNKDDIKIVFHVEFDDSELTSHLAGSIGYDFNFSADEIVWNDINPASLDYENYESGFLSGGHLYIPEVHRHNFEKLNLINFKRFECKKIILFGNRANQFHEINVDKDSFNWIDEFSSLYKSYELKQPDENESEEEIKLINYDYFNFNFNFFNIKSLLDDLNWVFCIYDKKVEIFQYGAKKPKIGFDDIDSNWAEWILFINNKILNNEKIYYSSKIDNEKSFNQDLFLEYINASKTILGKENSEKIIKSEFLDEENDDKKEENDNKYIQSIYEFRELPGERLLRYMSNVGEGTITSLRKAIINIAESDTLNGLKLKKYLQEDEVRITNRIIDNFSYLLHIETNYSENKWCIAKPSINLLPGLENRAIITGSRNDYLLFELFQNIKGNDTYSVSCIDNSKFLNHIKLQSNSDGSSNSIRISPENIEKHHSHELFSPTTLMISEFETLEELEPLKNQLGIEKINTDTSYSYIDLTPSLDKMIELSPQKQIKRFEKPEPLDDLIISKTNNGYVWIKEFYKGYLGTSLEENQVYRIKDFNASKYYIRKNEKTHLVTRDIAQYFHLANSDVDYIFYKKQLPGGILAIPSFLKLPKLFHKALGFCLGTNPKTIYFSSEDTNSLSPKYDLYFNIPEDLISTLCDTKMNLKIKEVENLNEIPRLIGKNNE